MLGTTIEKLVKEANEKKIFEYVEFKGERHEPEGSYIEISNKEFIAFIKIREHQRPAYVNGRIKDTRIDLISVSKFEENKPKSGEGFYKHIMWVEYGITSIEHSSNKNLSKEDNTPEVKNFIKKIRNYFDRSHYYCY